MKILAYLLSVVVTLAAVGGFSAAAAITTRNAPDGLIFLAVAALTMMTIGCVSLGSATFFWDPDASRAGRRIIRRFRLILLALEIVASALIIVWGVLSGAPVWLPLAAIAYVAVYSAAVLLVGPPLRRREIAREAVRPVPTDVDPTLIARTIRLAAIVGAAGLVVGAVGAALVLFVVDGAPSTGDVFQLGSLVIAFACYAALACCFRVTLRLNRVLVALTGRDPDLQRRLVRLIARRRPAELTGEEEVTAARYAEVLSISIPFSTSYLVLLYVGLLAQQIGTLLNPSSLGVIPPAILASSLVIIGAIGVPLNVVRGRRAKRYAADRAELLDPTLRQAQGTGRAQGAEPAQG